MADENLSTGYPDNWVTMWNVKVLRPNREPLYYQPGGCKDFPSEEAALEAAHVAEQDWRSRFPDEPARIAIDYYRFDARWLRLESPGLDHVFAPLEVQRYPGQGFMYGIDMTGPLRVFIHPSASDDCLQECSDRLPVPYAELCAYRDSLKASLVRH